MLPELPLPPGTRVVGDLHLDPEDALRVGEFVRYLGSLAGVPRFVILGDLFEYWIGPAQLRAPTTAPLLEALRERVEAGTAVDVVPGNRDFLLDAGFEQATGARIHRDGFVGRLPGQGGAGERVLVVHGDELCTLDRGYLRLRRVLRSRPLLWLAPRLPKGFAQTIARRLRRASQRAVAAKPAPEKAQQPEACEALSKQHECGLLVCGHAHEFRDELLPGGVRWLVVDAFGGPRDTLVVGPAGELGPLVGGA